LLIHHENPKFKSLIIWAFLKQGNIKFLQHCFPLLEISEKNLSYKRNVSQTCPICIIFHDKVKLFPQGVVHKLRNALFTVF